METYAPAASSQSWTWWTGWIGTSSAGGAKSSWCRMADWGRIWFRCFANVVLPEEDGPPIAMMTVRGAEEGTGDGPAWTSIVRRGEEDEGRGAPEKRWHPRKSTRVHQFPPLPSWLQIHGRWYQRVTF